MAVYVGDDELVPQRLVRPTHCRSRRLDHDPRRGSAAEYGREAFGLRRDPALDQLTRQPRQNGDAMLPSLLGSPGPLMRSGVRIAMLRRSMSIWGCIACDRPIDAGEPMVVVITVMPSQLSRVPLLRHVDAAPARWHWRCAPPQVRRYAPPLTTFDPSDSVT